MPESILILDFGSQFTQLIARRVREMNVYCEIHPYHRVKEALRSMEEVKGVILSGSPCSVFDKGAPYIDFREWEGKYPLLGICYGAQFLAHQRGGKVQHSENREYGRALLNITHPESPLFKDMPRRSVVWMSHGDSISKVPVHAEIIAETGEVPAAVFHFNDEPVYGIQFHPEVYHTEEGTRLLKNFVIGICGCKPEWTPGSFVNNTINQLKEQLNEDKVVLGLSGGVDSSVAAMLINKAIGTNLYCIFVDNGLLRKGEYEQVLHTYSKMGLNIKGVDSKELFYDALKGLKEPEIKRKTIGKMFIEVFNKEAHEIKNVKWLAQGTIYPDVIESISVKGPSSTIKSHHNVGGLPAQMHLKVVEPLRFLFKDEVRKAGHELGIADDLLKRHPFPGPGLAIRIIDDVTPEKVKILQDADAIFISHLRNKGLYDDVWQAAAILLPVRTVGVMGDERTYENVIALRAVTSTDGMTADWCRLPGDLLADVSNDIINKVKGINRVVYDISTKPPATIEWE